MRIQTVRSKMRRSSPTVFAIFFALIIGSATLLRTETFGADAKSVQNTTPRPLPKLSAVPALLDGLWYMQRVADVQGAVQRKARLRAEALRQKAQEIPGYLARIAECESHTNPRSIGGGGMYRGAYQFSESTWASVGGVGDPINASMAEQTKRAAMLYQRSGPGQWPVCGA